MIKEKIEVNNQVMIECEPVNLPDSYTVKVIKETISDIPSAPVSCNCWIDLSTWEDFHGVLRSGTKFTIHSVVAKIEEQIKSLTNCYLDWIDENGNILINFHEISSTVHQEFEITATRKKLRRLEQIAAFNVAKQLSCQSDTKELRLMKPNNYETSEDILQNSAVCLKLILKFLSRKKVDAT